METNIRTSTPGKTCVAMISLTVRPGGAQTFLIGRLFNRLRRQSLAKSLFIRVSIRKTHTLVEHSVGSA